MDKNFLIQLTNNLYRLTALFPKKEPLRYKIRELADDILASPHQEDFEVLNGFFEVAKEQNWVRTDEIFTLQREYDILKGEWLKEKEQNLKNNNSVLNEELKEHPQMIWPEPKPHTSRFSDRHDKILAYLKESGRAQVWQIKQILPDVSKRTLRRDFEYLVNEGIIERIGERNNTFYQIKLSQIE